MREIFPPQSLELNIQMPERFPAEIAIETARIREALSLLGFAKFDLHFEQTGVKVRGPEFVLNPIETHAKLKPNASP